VTNLREHFVAINQAIPTYSGIMSYFGLQYHTSLVQLPQYIGQSKLNPDLPE